MKAALLDRYDKNGREVRIADIPVPEINSDEVLVKIHTAGVNPLDNMITKGEVKLIVPYKMPAIKRILFGIAGKKFDKMAAEKNQKYYFIFVHEDGEGLQRISEMFDKNKIRTSVDEVFTLDEADKALRKVASGGSKGKTVIKINSI